MLANFKNKALKRYVEKGDASGLRPDWVRRIRLILSALNVAKKAEDLGSVEYLTKI